MKVLARLFIGFLTVLCAAISFAGTLTVTSPTEGAFLGTTNTLHFLISGATLEVTVKAVITGPAGSTTISNKFTPNSQGQIDNNLTLNFSSSSPEGDYTIVVSATELNNTYTDKTIHVKVDTVAPKIQEFNPLNGGFVKGIVKIRATIKETNIQDWTVKVNGQDIPNNTGSTNAVAVDWDTSGIISDGSQSVTITVRDLANNQTSQTINLTLDRVKPTITISFPTASTKIPKNTEISVIVDVTDASNASVDVTGIDVVVQRTDGTFVTRVARISAKPSGGTTLRWTGRIRKGLLPGGKFKLVATAVDRAGNVGNPQIVTITVG